MSKRKLRFYVPKGSSRKKGKLSTPVSDSHLFSSETNSNNISHVVGLPLSIYTSSTVQTIETLHARLHKSSECNGWILTCIPGEAEDSICLALCKLQYSPTNSTTEQVFMLTIKPEFNWNLDVHRHRVNSLQCPLLAEVPSQLNSVNSVVHLLSLLDNSKICQGNPETKFLDITQHHKGNFFDKSGTITS